MPSFDVVSKLEMHEVENALQQAKKEIAQRFDFKDTGTEIDKNEEGIRIVADSEGRIAAALKVLEEKLVKRKVPLKNLTYGAVLPAASSTVRQEITLQQGIATEKAREIVRVIKDSKKKVQASIQGDTVRVSGRDRDTLQEIIALLRHKPWLLALLPLWLVRGKAHFKRKLADHVHINPATLPYREDVLGILRAGAAQV